MILYIKSAGKNDKSFEIKTNNKTQNTLVFNIKEDLHEELKTYLEKNKITLDDFTDFIPIPTESFTGYRMAVNVCNTLKHFIKKTPVEALKYPKYHKKPNITFSNKNK